jgi:hypothetical protein
MTETAEEIKTVKQVKSKKRVTDHGEVFTDHKEVNTMLDLVKQETENIESRFLEPACGTGNFLVEILRRKLTIVEKRYSKSQLEFERYAIAALCSIYGVELLPDNAKECRQRLLGIFTHFYISNFKKAKSNFLQSAEFILSRNILCGDALTLKTPDEKHPIVFSEWAFVKGSFIKRKDYVFEEIIPKDKYDMFYEKKVSVEGNPYFIPEAIKEYPLTHFLNLADGNAE